MARSLELSGTLIATTRIASPLAFSTADYEEDSRHALKSNTANPRAAILTNHFSPVTAKTRMVTTVVSETLLVLSATLNITSRGMSVENSPNVALSQNAMKSLILVTSGNVILSVKFMAIALIEHS
ncbi:MAG TPA: hypothetical protein EYP20_01870 [Aigarchaeota archaeon]|nr:hypothetical protein [Aigarchaeota archaeon]